LIVQFFRAARAPEVTTMLQPWILQFFTETVALLPEMTMVEPEVPARFAGV
jgi:hypothetical protein